MTGTSRSGGDRSIGQDMTEDDGGPIRPQLPTGVAEKYDEILSQLPHNVLRKVDVHSLSNLARLLHLSDLYAKITLDDPMDHKTGRLYLNTLDRIHRMSASFGLTPADRKRLAFAPPEPENPMDQWLAEATGN